MADGLETENASKLGNMGGTFIDQRTEQESTVLFCFVLSVLRTTLWN